LTACEFHPLLVSGQAYLSENFVIRTACEFHHAQGLVLHKMLCGENHESSKNKIQSLNVRFLKFCFETAAVMSPACEFHFTGI